MQIILAGFETTGGTLRFMVHNLAENPEEQQKLYDEIQDVIGEVRRLYDENDDDDDDVDDGGVNDGGGGGGGDGSDNDDNDDNDYYW